MERFAGEGAVCNGAGERAIGVGAGRIFLDRAGGEVGEFPGFADGFAFEFAREGFMENGAKALAAPEAFLEDGLEFQGVHGRGLKRRRSLKQGPGPWAE